jgi:hypothetical protein
MLERDTACAGSREVRAARMSPCDALIEVAVRAALQPDQVSLELDAARIAWNLGGDRCALRRRLLLLVNALDDEQ